MRLSTGRAESALASSLYHNGSGLCREVLELDTAIHCKPEIFNIGQGSQFTSEALISVLRREDIRISMDGKGCWHDNVMLSVCGEA